ncbi:MAG TPA: hypothetical protein VHN18_16310 [Micromonosporaceae bacterium]|nr:hypothetical protein [Micromonosporaceae bacterium]
MTVGEQLTADERTTLKTAAFGVVFLVSNADPGFLGMIRESFAASGVISSASGLVKHALTTGGLPQLPRDNPAQVEELVLPMLRRSVQILEAKAPAEVDNYRRTVLAATERVAGASAGVDSAEAEVIGKVRAALGVP